MPLWQMETEWCVTEVAETFTEIKQKGKSMNSQPGNSTELRRKQF